MSDSSSLFAVAIIKISGIFMFSRITFSVTMMTMYRSQNAVQEYFFYIGDKEKDVFRTDYIMARRPMACLSISCCSFYGIFFFCL